MLDSSTTKLQSILSSLSDGLIVMDSQGLVEEFNPAAENLFGYTRSEAIGKSVSDFIPTTTKETYEDFLKTYVFSGKHKIVGTRREIVCKRRDDTTFHAAFSISEFSHEGERFFTTTIENISKRVAREEKLKQILQNTDKASDAKSEFLANMSHELRTPLNGVMGMLELIKGTSLTPKQDGFVTTAYDSASSLLQVISSILDFSKLESGDFKLHRGKIDIREIIQTSTSSAAAAKGDKRLQIVSSVAHDIPNHLSGDGKQLQQVISNLLSNAVKFTETGHIGLRVSTEEKNKSKIKVRIEVQDTGIGIAEAQITSLFEPFTQQDSSSTRRYGGSGLGLTVARRLVEFLGGELKVSSAVGEGTTFWFSLWLDVYDAKSKQENVPNGLKNGIRVLVVGDRNTEIESVMDAIRDLNMEAHLANSPGRALTLAQQAANDSEPFQVVFLDSQVSGLNGNELAGVIRSDPNLDDSQLILLSSDAEAEPDILGSGIGMTLHKPISAQNIEECFQSLTSLNRRPFEKSRTMGRHDNASFKNKSVLFVDDSNTNLKVGREMLRKFGLDADLARNGREALLSMQEKRYDLVLMDCQMPVMDGYTATREIRKSESSKGEGNHVPIVAVTAHALEGDREASLDAGMDDYLTKPFAISELESVLHRWL